MPKGRIQRIQDNVHGLMEFVGVEGIVVELLRTPELQRLRRIKQLGLANYVFPGAEHSRLTHCLGASHIAVRFARRLQEVTQDIFTPALCIDEICIRDLAVAALCHDLGHGPFSHAWEREIIGDHFSRNEWTSALGLSAGPWCEKLKWHEIVGHGLLTWKDGSLHKLLEQQEEGSSDRIHQLLCGNYYLDYLPRILAGDVDVDRADFIRRDTFQTGVGYGRYDLEWLISTCSIGMLSDSYNHQQWVLGFDERKSVRVIEQFLMARRALYDTVYYHKTVRCAEGMMALFLRRLKVVMNEGTPILEGRIFESLARIIDGKAVPQEELLSLDDSIIHFAVESVSSSKIKDETVRDLARRISARDLFKIVPVNEKAVGKFILDGHWHDKLCEVIKPYAPGDSEYYFHLDQRSFRAMSNIPGEEVYLVDSNRNAQPAIRHSAFANLRDEEEQVISIFTLHEAVPAVKELIENN